VYVLVCYINCHFTYVDKQKVGVVKINYDTNLKIIQMDMRVTSFVNEYHKNKKIGQKYIQS
jgi:hypothetical protein